MNISNITGASSAYDPSATAPQVDDDMGMETFMQLLVTQLQHQDPLNPMEDQDFTAQLAQFSSLEQLEGINEGVGGLNEAALREDMLGAVGFIGKEVLAVGNSVSKDGDSVSPMTYELGTEVSEMYINIYDSQGGLVYTETMGARQPGKFNYQWDGKNYNGVSEPDGQYSVAIAAEDANGEAVFVPIEVGGKVIGVSNKNGMPYLRLEDGREVGFYNMVEVTDMDEFNSSGSGQQSSDTSGQ